MTSNSLEKGCPLYTQRKDTPGPISQAVASTGFDSKGVEDVLSIPSEPWAAEDPKARADQVFSLRLNRFEMVLLRHLAEQNEDLSMQKIVRRALVPELRRRVGL